MQTNVWLLASWGGVDRRLVVIRHLASHNSSLFWSTPHAYRANTPSLLHRGLKKEKTTTKYCWVLNPFKMQAHVWLLASWGGGWPKIGCNSSLASHNSSLFGRHRTRIEPRPRPSFTAALKIKNKNKILPRVPCF